MHSNAYTLPLPPRALAAALLVDRLRELNDSRPWDERHETVQPGDHEIEPYLHALLGFFGIADVEGFVRPFRGGKPDGPSLTPMRRLERLSIFLMVGRFHKQACVARLCAARQAQEKSDREALVPHQHLAASVLGLGRASLTRRGLLASAVAPLTRALDAPRGHNPLDLTASEAMAFRALIRKQFSSPAFVGVLCIFLDLWFCASQVPERWNGMILPTGLGLPRESLEQLALRLEAVQAAPVRYACCPSDANEERYQPGWARLHSGERHRLMLENTAIAWGNRELAPLLVVEWASTVRDAALGGRPAAPTWGVPAAPEFREFFERTLLTAWNL